MLPISLPELEGEKVNLPTVVARNEQVVRDGFWKKLARILANIPFAESALAAYYCALDGTTPLRAKGILLASLAYFIAPIDIIPDFILGVGFTDDLTVLLTALSLIRTHMKPEHLDKARETLDRIRRETPPV
jgi:uncharacterized membrane protein YkvA (DUF1232 family)